MPETTADRPALTRREREVMDIVHALGEATAARVRGAMEDPPTNAAVRSVLRILVDKGHLTYERDGPRYVYAPSAPLRARRTALRHVLRTFFGGSVEGAVAALLELDEARLDAAERERIKRMIDRAAREGR